MFRYGRPKCEGISVAQLDGISVLNQPLLPEEIDQEDCKESWNWLWNVGASRECSREAARRAETDTEELKLITKRGGTSKECPHEVSTIKEQ